MNYNQIMNFFCIRNKCYLYKHKYGNIYIIAYMHNLFVNIAHLILFCMRFYLSRQKIFQSRESSFKQSYCLIVFKTLLLGMLNICFS